MSNLLLSEAQMERLHSSPRAMDDHTLVTGIVFVNRNGLRWCDASQAHDLLFAKMIEGVVSQTPDQTTIMITPPI